ncbi:hypothetical protein I6E41_11585 [Prevotella stercorea]|nr:hypothetical protein [Leyella stercorea]
MPESNSNICILLSLFRLYRLLERYRTYFDGILDEYLKESKRHYVILSCKNKAETSDYEGYGFEVYGWDDIIEAMCGGDNELKPSGSDIFDEFWINW